MGYLLCLTADLENVLRLFCRTKRTNNFPDIVIGNDRSPEDNTFIPALEAQILLSLKLG